MPTLRKTLAELLGLAQAAPTPATPTRPAAAADAGPDLGASSPKETTVPIPTAPKAAAPARPAPITPKAEAPDDAPEKKDDEEQSAECNGQCPKCCSANNARAETDEESPDKKDDDTMPTAATVAELKAAFPQDPTLCLEAVENKWSIEKAKAVAYDRVSAAAAKKAEIEKGLGGEGVGAQPVAGSARPSGPTQPGGTGLAARTWPREKAKHNPFFDEVARLIRDEKMTEGQAIVAAQRANPALHKASIKPVPKKTSENAVRD